MNNLWRKLILVVVGLLLAGLSAALAFNTVHAQDFPRSIRESALTSTVMIYTLDNDFNVIASGSGSIVAETGQVLSNFHVVGENETGELYNNDGVVVIAITTNPRKPANPQFFGQVVRADPDLDLSLITIVADIDGNDLTGCLSLPTYTLGDSDELFPGDKVAVIGFPGIGGQTVTFTEGIISGFEEDPQAGGPWLKTDTEINPGNSGGSAIDTTGNLVGVPTAGIIDPDSAGKIGLLRPINAAGDILDDLSGLGVPGCNGGTSTPIEPVVPIGGENGQIILNFQGFTLDAEDEEFVTNAPAGVEEIYANFEYIGVSADTPFESQWYLNGEAMEDSFLQFDEWPLDAGDGFFWINTANPDGLEDGIYTIELTVGERTLTSDEFTVGGGGGEVADEVTITGRIVSADTGRAVRDALFVVLAPGITWDDLDTNDPSHILDIAFTDSKGNFQSNIAFPLNEVYSLGVLADGFEPLLADEVDLEEFEPTGGFVDFGDIGIKAE